MRALSLFVLATVTILGSIPAMAQPNALTKPASARKAPRLAAKRAPSATESELFCAGKTINIAGSGDYRLLGGFPGFGPAAPNAKLVCAQSARVLPERQPGQFVFSFGGSYRRSP